jgi:hypothetical protein
MNDQPFLGLGLLPMGVLLCGCAIGAPSTTEEGKPGHADRTGGQAGLEEQIEKRTSTADQSSADRKGGQAGLEEHMEKGTGVTDQPADRIGGQAGQEKPLEQR